MASSFGFAKIGEVFPDTLRVWSLEKVNKNETTNTSIIFHPVSQGICIRTSVSRGILHSYRRLSSVSCLFLAHTISYPSHRRSRFGLRFTQIAPADRGPFLEGEFFSWNAWNFKGSGMLRRNGEGEAKPSPSESESVLFGKSTSPIGFVTAPVIPPGLESHANLPQWSSRTWFRNGVSLFSSNPIIGNPPFTASRLTGEVSGSRMCRRFAFGGVTQCGACGGVTAFRSQDDGTPLSCVSIKTDRAVKVDGGVVFQIFRRNGPTAAGDAVLVSPRSILTDW